MDDNWSRRGFVVVIVVVPDSKILGSASEYQGVQRNVRGSGVPAK